MIFDLHNDILTHKTVSKSSVLADLESFDSIKKIVLAVWTTQLSQPFLEIPKLFSSASSSQKFCLAIEDLHFVSAQSIDLLCKLVSQNNVLYAGLCWNFANALCAGAHASGGLTSLGKSVVNALTDCGVFVDTAHLNRESFWDVAWLTKKPIINSHCCFCGVWDHPRNLLDEQIGAILDTGGIVGLTFVPKFLCKKDAKIVDVFAHLDYFISRFGYTGLCIGTDFFGSDSVSGLESYAGFEALTYAMQSHGYTSEVIDSIFYKNAQRFFDKALAKKLG